jgi:hypothetical protein
MTSMFIASAAPAIVAMDPIANSARFGGGGPAYAASRVTEASIVGGRLNVCKTTQ